ncbi:unnamed protein product [Adineta steineri]|uniref:Uncharacterized protein n=1 Tax=Adineta steineri TaxID=433720 RepID=A0A819HGX9_9BILA|nr:unnamed protein product [Adineta steineri]
MIRFVFLFAWIFAVVVQGINYTTWMTDHASLISHKTLGDISLVATHGSGAYNLSNNFINLDSYGPPFTTLYNCLGDIASMIGRPLGHIVKLFANGVQAVNECTTKDIYSQLIDGNRALDLRLSVFENDIYIAHMLQGPSLSNVLAQVLKFLHGTTGELVYMTLGHPYGFNQKYINLLALLLNPFLRDGFAITPVAYPENLLRYTYAELINSGRSCIVIVIDDTINPDVNSFFSSSIYSPPDGGSNTLYGFYTNTDAIEVVISNQTANYIHAGAIPAPAAIYMTLTPTNIVAANLANELIYEIFENLNTYQIYQSFFHLNIRFQNLCKHANLSIQVGMSSASKTTFQRYYDDFFVSLTEDITRCSQLQTLTLSNIECSNFNVTTSQCHEGTDSNFIQHMIINSAEALPNCSKYFPKITELTLHDNDIIQRKSYLTDDLRRIFL